MTQEPFSLPYLRDERFVGRTLELEQIHAALQHSDVVVVRTSGEGMGTTALAIEYAHRYQKFYSEIVSPMEEVEPPWADRRRRNRFAGHFMQGRRGEQGTRLQLIFGSARIAAKTSKSEGKQIITATDYDLSIQYPTVDLGPLNPHDAMAMLGPLADRDPQGARKIVEMTCGVPLALRLVIALLRQSKERRIRDVVSFFSAEERASISWAIEGAFRLSWDALIDAEARRILQLFSLFPARTGVSMAQIVNLLSSIHDDTGVVATNVSLLLQKRLLEERGDGKVYIHPYIAKLIAPTVENVEALLLGCESNLTERLGNLDWLEDEVDSRGANAVREDVGILGYARHHQKIYTSHDEYSRAINELLQAVANRGKEASRDRTLFLQQIAASTGHEYGSDKFKELKSLAQQRLEERAEPHFQWEHEKTTEQGQERRSTHWVRAAFCGDECHAITVGNDGRVAIWDVNRAEIVEERDLGTHFHHAPVIAPVGLVVAGKTNHGVELYDLTNGASLGVVNEQAEVAIASNGRYVACMYRGRRGELLLVRHDLAQATLAPQTVIDRSVLPAAMHGYEFERGEGRSRMAISNDGRRVLVALGGDNLFVWEPVTGTMRVIPFNDQTRTQHAMPIRRSDDNENLVVSANGRFAITLGNGKLYIWDLYPNVQGRAFMELDDLDAWPPPSYATAASEDCLVLHRGDAIQIRALATGRLLSVMPITGRYDYRARDGLAIATSRNGSTIMIASSTPRFLRWVRPENRRTLQEGVLYR